MKPDEALIISNDYEEQQRHGVTVMALSGVVCMPAKGGREGCGAGVLCSSDAG